MPHPQLHGINILLPTYKRVRSGLLPRFLRSFEDMAADPKCLSFTILVNKDDSETQEWVREWWIAVEERGIKASVILAACEKPHLGWFYNTLYQTTPFQDPGLAVTLLGDDMECMTKGWDTRVLAELNKRQGLCVVHCRDGIQNGRIAVNFFTSRAWVDATGGKFMVDVPVDFVDVAATEVARGLGLEVYLDDVVITHHHHSLKSEKDWDDGFRRLRGEYGKMGNQEERVRVFVKDAIDHFTRLERGHG